MSAVRPLPVEVELEQPEDFPIVLPIVDGVTDVSVAHLPAPQRILVRGHGMGLDWDGYDFPPARWDAACGAVHGWVYNRSGKSPLRHVPICVECVLAVAGFQEVDA